MLAIVAVSDRRLGWYDTNGDGAYDRVVVAELDAVSGRALRSWHTSNRMANVAAFQTVAVRELVNLLEVEASPSDMRILEVGGTTVPLAFESFISGLGAMDSCSADTAQGGGYATELLERAIEKGHIGSEPAADAVPGLAA